VNALALTFGLLTAVPVGRAPRVERRDAASAMLLAPLSTAPMLVVLTLAHLLAETKMPALLVAVAVLAAEALVTRMLHLDGLADTADGLASGAGRERSLAVMKASDIGPAGVVTIVLVLFAQTGALAALLPSVAGTVLAGLAWFASRHALAWACRQGVPAASETGLGVLVAGTVSRTHLVVAAAFVLTSAAALGVVAGLGWWHGPVVAVAAVAAAELVVRRCTTRLGGITGDVLGAAVELALTAGLVAAVVV
jgi:adenosylcobinamide-GDP ribazoletransferase